MHSIIVKSLTNSLKILYESHHNKESFDRFQLLKQFMETPCFFFKVKWL